MAAFHFECIECRSRYNENEVRYVCPECSKAQVPGGTVRGVLTIELDTPLSRLPSDPAYSPETLAEIWPIASSLSLPPLTVGNTPLLPAPILRQRLGMSRLFVKDDTRNPSGSTKDRASSLVVAKAKEYQYDTVTCASTGNAACALAALGAAAGLRIVVFVPASAPQAKLVQIAAYGAELVRVEGSYDDAFEASLNASIEHGWYNRNTAYNPFTIEGKKTAALEIASAMAANEAEVIFVPTGDGVIISGIAKGFTDLVRGGLIRHQPRLIAVQPEGSCAIARALRDNSDLINATSAKSVADSLVVNAPRNAIRALNDIRASGGTGVIVSDEAILDAITMLARSTGVFAEPAAAATLAGLLTARREGLVNGTERIVLLITGNGLKDIAAAKRALGW